MKAMGSPDPRLGLLDYYSRQAADFDETYQRPERQNDLATLEALLPRLLQGQRVLEVACGTGYWTRILAPACAAIVATDCSFEMLEVARSKRYPAKRVQLSIADAYDLSNISGSFTAGFAAFWWSHVPVTEVARFLDRFHARLEPGARVVFVDNCYVAGSSMLISGRDQEGNTYQERQLKDGTRHRIVKNYPTDSELQAAVKDCGAFVHIVRLTYYWCLSYILRKPQTRL